MQGLKTKNAVLFNGTFKIWLVLNLYWNFHIKDIRLIIDINDQLVLTILILLNPKIVFPISLRLYTRNLILRNWRDCKHLLVARPGTELIINWLIESNLNVRNTTIMVSLFRTNLKFKYFFYHKHSFLLYLLTYKLYRTNISNSIQKYKNNLNWFQCIKK